MPGRNSTERWGVTRPTFWQHPILVQVRPVCCAVLWLLVAIALVLLLGAAILARPVVAGLP